MSTRDPRLHSLPTLPPRPRDGHKGTFGTVLVVGGSSDDHARMIGAPALAGLGALRAGCGLCRLMMPAPILNAALASLTSATGLPLIVDDAGRVIPFEAVASFDRAADDASCIVIGPGLGSSEAALALVLRAIQRQDPPLVIDADALNLLATIPDLFRDFHARAILTPHPGEFRRLAAAHRITHDPSQDDSRVPAAEALAQKLGAIVVLKGARTVVSDGQRTWTCPAGDPCMATGGSGDVLAGVVAGLAAQHHRQGFDLFESARAAVAAHALAGERWAATNAAAGMLASELANLIPAGLDTLRS
ncbi:MAG: NAD(P)H-hydrate dehydratase [Phycisphaerae bacterium]|nr:NAD(P)H-hydrate dehydratase [Phycisphaerae bacterium]